MISVYNIISQLLVVISQFLINYILLKYQTFKSSGLEVLCKKGVLRNLTKFTGKHLCQSLFFFKETLAQVFFCEFFHISKNTFLHRTPLVAASKRYFFSIYIISWFKHGGCLLGVQLQKMVFINIFTFE